MATPSATRNLGACALGPCLSGDKRFFNATLNQPAHWIQLIDVWWQRQMWQHWVGTGNTLSIIALPTTQPLLEIRRSLSTCGGQLRPLSLRKFHRFESSPPPVLSRLTQPDRPKVARIVGRLDAWRLCISAQFGQEKLVQKVLELWPVDPLRGALSKHRMSCLTQ